MKPGTLVVCIDNSRYAELYFMATPKLEPAVYTVKAVKPCSCGQCPNSGILLEELDNAGKVPFGEPMYDLADFRMLSIQPDIDFDGLFDKEVQS